MEAPIQPNDVPLPLISAAIAAFVSLVVGVLTYAATRRSQQNLIKMQERELTRRFTERLYDLRLAAYPKAFEITDRLRLKFMFGGDLKREELEAVSTQLHQWHTGSAAFLLSKKGRIAFYKLVDYLEMQPEAGAEGFYSGEQRAAISKAANAFWGELRNDVGLLHEEEYIRDKSK